MITYESIYCYSNHFRLNIQYDKHASIKIFSLEMVQSPFCPYISHVQCHTSQTNKNVYIITHTLVIYHTHHMHGLSHYYKMIFDGIVSDTKYN